LAENNISSVFTDTTRRFHHFENTFQLEIVKDPMAVQFNRRSILDGKEYF
jgi:hypothetical protein